MPALTLTYFDFDGGRGEPARLALAIGGIPVEDRRIALKDWPELKASMPFQVLPVLDVDGRRITQCNTINRYVGKLADLYPGDAWQAALCDETMDAVEDIGTQIGVTIGMTDEAERKAARERLAGGPIPMFLARLAAQLGDRGGVYFADGRLTVADLKVFVWIRHLRSGNLDHVPRDLVDRTAPLLVQHFEHVNAESGVASYYAKRRAAATA